MTDPKATKPGTAPDAPASFASTNSTSLSTSLSTSTPFPLIDLVPKKETNVLEFLNKYPSYDGRNVIVGILDTGMDPAAHGLQYLPDGVTPKLIDVVDCTGSGDVDVSTVATAEYVSVADDDDDDGTGTDGSPGTGTSKDYWKVTGLTGRELKLSTDWKILPFPVTTTTTETKTKTGEATSTTPATEVTASTPTTSTTTPPTRTVQVRLGVKRAYELFPARLTSRVVAERRKLLDAQLHRYAADIRRRLNDCKEAIAAAPTDDKPTTQTSASTSTQTSSSTASTTITITTAAEHAKIRDDWQAVLDVVTSKEWEDDPGPLYDTVVFYDGTDYRAVVDVHEQGDLTSSSNCHAPLTSFAKERQYAVCGTLDQFNFAVNFYRDGTVLSLVSDASPHGTHVGGITAAAEGERSGVAPGAQLVSLKIGDSRLGSMETGTSLTRAVAEAVRHKCDVINLSYGEAAAVPDTGRFIELANELVWKHNIVFVSSAGNNGPAISTVGAPGGSSSACIGVAAYVSPDMMRADYSMPVNNSGEGATDQTDDVVDSVDTTTSVLLPAEQHIGTTYTWSSVGPTFDGDNGVNITAPGGAITSVSNWTLQKSMLMNGTSMSSPHATGCVALLISACKAEGIPVSPARIRRALENTARTLPKLSTLQQGWGMIQVDAAFAYLQSLRAEDTEDIYFDVRVENRSGSPRGIYLRQPDEANLRQSFSIGVNPQFRREDVISDEMQRRRIDFEMHFTITSSASWVTVPEHFMLMNNGRSFKVDVDPTGLELGVHTARVCGYDSDKPDRKVVFSLPITVVRSYQDQPVVHLGELEFHPAEVKRFFVVPPPGSTWMDVTIRDTRDANKDAESTTKLIVLHTVQMLPHASYQDFEHEKYFHLLPSQTVVSSVSVEDGITCEVDLARYWSTLGTTKVDVSIQFRGIRPVPNRIHMLCGAGGTLVRMNSDLKDESVNPVAKLTKWMTPLRPKSEGVISPLGSRDILPSREKEIYQLILTYEFTQEEKGAFTARALGLQDLLYESAFESQMMMIFDGEKKYLGVCDFGPSPVTVPKGPVTIRMQIRHDDPSKLETLKDLNVWIQRKLDKEISLATHTTRESLTTGNASFRKRVLRKGTCASVVFAEPAVSKLPSGYKNGDILTGTVTYASGDASLPGDGKRPGGFEISYSVGPKPEKTPTESTEAEPKDERTAEEKMDEAVRDIKVAQLGKLTSTEKEAGKFEELYAKLEAEYPDHLPLRMANLKYVDTHKKRSEMLEDVISAADAVVSRISEDALALHFGRKSDTEDPEAVKERKDMKEKKMFLIEALARLALAYADTKSEDATAKFDETLKTLKAWTDIDTSDKYAALVIERETRAGRHGSVLKVLNKLITNAAKEKDSIKVLSKSELYEKRAAILKKLGFDILVEYDMKNRVIACPKAYALF